MRKNAQDLAGFTEDTIWHLQANRQFRTAETYEAALRSFQRFLGAPTLAFREITPTLIARYEVYLAGRGLSRNTSSFYMRILRAIYNRAVDAGLVRQRSPFRHVYTGVDKTRKRAVPLSVIRRIKHLDLSGSPSLTLARDLFLFSFYTRGMSFVDMAGLTPGNLNGGYLRYIRRKTGQPISIRWEKCMQEIVDRYPDIATGRLLPIVVRTGVDPRRQYRTALFEVNKGLAEISRLLRLDCPLTTYVARHSWASIAYANEIPLSVISEGMGHGSEKVTRVYLASVNSSAVDKANRRILKML